jgi:hypothetical protein
MLRSPKEMVMASKDLSEGQRQRVRYAGTPAYPAPTASMPSDRSAPTV